MNLTEKAIKESTGKHEEKNVRTTEVLNSFYAEANYKYPLEAMLPARQDEMSRARLTVVFTQPVMSQEKLSPAQQR